MTRIDQPTAPLGLVFATMSRPHVAQRLIESVRRFFPDMPIYVADQTYPTPQQQAFYDQTGCKVAWLDHDAGVCASRNAAVAMVSQPYFVLCDDDFIFTDETDFSRALTVLEAQPDIGVVGGRLFDLHQNPATGEISRQARFWELQMHYDPGKRQLMTIPVHYFAPDPKYVGDVSYFECDAVMNFAVFRTTIFDETVRWDPRFKSNGEHEDFYLNLKVNSDHRVAYIPEIVAEHHHPPLRGYSKMRNRTKGWQLFLDKWNLRQMVDLDGILRVNGGVQTLQPYATGYDAFYSSLPLLTKKPERRQGSVLVSNVNGKLGSKRREAAFNNRPTLAIVSGRFRVEGSDRMVAVGGNWRNPTKNRSARPTTTPRDHTIPIDVDDWRFEIPDYEAHIGETDQVAYLMPTLTDEASAAVGVRTLRDIDVSMSLAKDGHYAVYLAPVQIHGQALMLNAWNALPVPPAYLTGELVLEICVMKNGTILFESSGRLKEPCQTG